MKNIVAALACLSISSVVCAQTVDIKLEAETAKYSNCEMSSSSKFSGGKALKMTKTNARLEFEVNIDKREKFNVIIAGNGIGGEKVANCSINDNNNTFSLNNYGEVTVGTFFLNKGTNHIVITPSWTWFEVDYLRVNNDVTTIDFNISPNPVDNSATKAARSMYTFLLDNFGEKTISGMMTGDMSSANGNILQHDDMRAVYNVSGKYPALVGFDFMNATGKTASSSWMKSYTRSSIELAKDTYRRGGIPAFTWHWRDPSRKTDEFYSDKTDMKISQAMNSDGSWNTSSDLYNKIVSDIHTIADYFLELQNEGMACIFRPLHEANGGWFWWGREGGEKCTKLYHLIYNEMVNVKGVHNIIWVLNSDISDPTWDPGDDYYDVISTDIYNNPFDYSSCSGAFDSMRVLTSGQKIIALAENGPLPDIQNEFDDDAVWSWWMPWYQTWGGNFVNQTSADEWRKCMNDPRVITLEDVTNQWNNSGISDIIIPDADNDVYYNIHGQKVTPGAKGIYIHNGKKIMITQ